MPRFDNSQLAHVWAQRRIPAGQSNSGNFSFSDRTLYSYAEPIGVFKEIGKETYIFINDDDFSVTTSKHQSLMYRALSHKSENMLRVNRDLIHLARDRPLSGDKTDWKTCFNRFARDQEREIAESIGKASRARLERNKKWSLQAAKNTIENLMSVSKACKLGYKVPKIYAPFMSVINENAPIESLFESLLGMNAAQIEQSRARKKKEELAKERARKKELALQQERLTKWLAGDSSVHSIHVTKPNGAVFLRRHKTDNNDLLQTSKGANVPWSHAVKLFRFLKYCRTYGITYSRNTSNKILRVGHFTVDHIDSAGNFTAACHTFDWQEIESLARAQGVFDLSDIDFTQITENESV